MFSYFYTGNICSLLAGSFVQSCQQSVQVSLKSLVKSLG